MLTRHAHRQLLLALAISGTPAVAMAQNSNDSHREQRDSIDVREREVRRQRQGAGLRVGSWRMNGLTQTSGATYSSLPAFEGYWQKGLDRHIALETGFGFWQRTQRANSSAGSESIGSYVVPMTTSIKVYPATSPGDALEPFMIAGAGFTLGVDDRNTVSGGLLGGGNSGTLIIPGIGIRGGAGVEYHLGAAFGLSVTAGYQFVRFFDYVGNDRTYKGMQLMGGVVYRFQY